MSDIPPSLAVTPNIAWEDQTIEQLVAERDYWIERVKDASGFTSAKAADDFRQSCEAWIARRKALNAAPPAHAVTGSTTSASGESGVEGLAR